MKFKSDMPGVVSAIRFYKGSQNTGTHIVSLWTVDGALLGRNVSSGETALGWQQVYLSTPVNIFADTTYIASYHTTSGHYSFNSGYFNSQYYKLPLHALADSTSGGNGLWQTSATPIFPTQNYLAGNFWVDVVLAAGGPDTRRQSFPGFRSRISRTAGGTVNWTTNEPADGQVEIISPCAASPCLTALVSAFTTSHAITLSGLNANTLYTYRIRSKDSSNNLATTANQTFTTAAAPDTTPPVVSAISVTNITSSRRHGQLDNGRTGGWPGRNHQPVLFESLPDGLSLCAHHVSRHYADRPERQHAVHLPHPSKDAYRQSGRHLEPDIYNSSGFSDDIFAVELHRSGDAQCRRCARDRGGSEVQGGRDGSISAIRFYKGPQNTGTHTVSLWTAAGALLGRSVSSGETASGWQQVNLSPPVNISANVTYVASYLTTSGILFFQLSVLCFSVQQRAAARFGRRGLRRQRSIPSQRHADFPDAKLSSGQLLGRCRLRVRRYSASDTTPPIVSAISVTNITSSGGTVNWTTDEPADGQVEIISPCACKSLPDGVSLCVHDVSRHYADGPERQHALHLPHPIEGCRTESGRHLEPDVYNSSGFSDDLFAVEHP